MAKILMIPRRVVPKTVREMVVGAALETCRSQGEPTSFGGPAIRKRWYVLKPRVRAFSSSDSDEEELDEEASLPSSDPASSWPGRGRELFHLAVRRPVPPKPGTGGSEDETGPMKRCHKAPDLGCVRASSWPGRG